MPFICLHFFCFSFFMQLCMTSQIFAPVNNSANKNKRFLWCTLEVLILVWSTNKQVKLFQKHQFCIKNQKVAILELPSLLIFMFASLFKISVTELLLEVYKVYKNACVNRKCQGAFTLTTDPGERRVRLEQRWFGPPDWQSVRPWCPDGCSRRTRSRKRCSESEMSRKSRDDWTRFKK